MLGSLFMVMGLSLMGVKTGVDKRLHRTAIALLGLFIGSRIQAGELIGLVFWYPSVIAMLVYMALMLFGGFWIFKRARVGRMNALFCSYPGSMNSALVLAERVNGDLRWIAISHSLRLVTVVSGAAIVASFFVEDVTLSSSSPSLSMVDSLPLLLAPLCWWLGGLVKIPLPEFLGPMVAGAIIANLGFDYALPTWVVLSAFLVLGASVGARFSGTQWSQVISMGRYGITFALFALVVAAWLVSSVTPLAFVAVLLALIPGGVGEMAVIAMVMGIDPVYVVSHHIVRLLLLIFMTPLMVRMVNSPVR